LGVSAAPPQLALDSQVAIYVPDNLGGKLILHMWRTSLAVRKTYRKRSSLFLRN